MKTFHPKVLKVNLQRIPTPSWWLLFFPKIGSRRSLREY
jgi:hypothetical protein